MARRTSKLPLLTGFCPRRGGGVVLGGGVWTLVVSRVHNVQQMERRHVYVLVRTVDMLLDVSFPTIRQISLNSFVSASPQMSPGIFDKTKTKQKNIKTARILIVYVTRGFVHAKWSCYRIRTIVLMRRPNIIDSCSIPLSTLHGKFHSAESNSPKTTSKTGPGKTVFAFSTQVCRNFEPKPVNSELIPKP